MKLIILTALNLFAVSAMAQVADKPFSLEPGKYSESCYSITVSDRFGEMDRQHSASEGQVTVVKQDNVTVETSVTADADSSMTSTVRTETKDLGNSRFEIKTDSYSTVSFRGQVYDTKNSWVVTVKVDGRITFNESVVRDGVRRDNLVGETLWTVLPDNRIVVQSYSREPSTVKETINGEEKTVTTLSSNTTCIYKKLKK